MPIKANEDWAFLIGLFYSSGGSQQNEIHFAIEKPVIAYLQSDLFVKSIGARAEPVSQGRKKPHGTYQVRYAKVILDVLKGLSVKTATSFRLGNGKWVPSRYLALAVPSWIKDDRDYMNRFVEGYINGLRASAALKGRLDNGKARGARSGYANGSPHLQVFFNININFCCHRMKDVVEFMRDVTDYLASLGIKGYISRERNDGRTNIHFCYGFHDMTSLQIFTEHFRLMKTRMRLRPLLRLAATKDTVLNFALQRTGGMDNYVLGMLYEKPRTLKELIDNCPKRPYNMTVLQVIKPSIDKLIQMGVIKIKDDTLVYEPSQFRESMIAAFKEKIAERKQKLRALSDKLLYVCRKCSTGGEEVACYHCGKEREPCTRNELRRLNGTIYYGQLRRLGVPMNMVGKREKVDMNGST